MGDTLRFDTAIAEADFDKLANAILKTSETVGGLKHEIDDIKNHKAKIEVDDSGLKIGKKSVERFKEEIDKDFKLSKQQIFDSKTIQDEINRLTKTLDTAYEKVNVNGKRLTESQTERFVESFLSIKKFGEYFGKDLSSKYQGMYDQIINLLSSDDISKTIGDINRTVLKQIQSTFDGDYIKKFISSNITYITDEVKTQIAQSLYDINEIKRKSISDTEAQLREAEQQQAKEIAEAQSVVQSELDRINSTRKDGEVFKVDLDKFAQIQEMFKNMVQLLSEANIEVQPLEEAFQSFTQGIYVDQDIVKSSSLQKLEAAKQHIDELENSIANLHNQLYRSVDENDVDKIINDYVDEILKLKNEINELQDALTKTQDELDYSYNRDVVSSMSYESALNYINKLEIKVTSLQSELNQLKSVESDLLSGTKNTNGVNADKIEQTVNEVETVTNNVASELSQAFDSEIISQFNILLSQIAENLSSIKKAIGTVDDNNGFKNIISNIDTLLTKLDNVYAKIGTGVYNVTVNEGIDKNTQKTNESIKEYTRKTSTRYQNAYDKLVQRAGGKEELLFAYMNNILNAPGGINELMNLYSSVSLSKINSSEEKIYRMMSFFKLLRQAVSDESFGLDISGISIPSGSDESFRSKIRELSGIKNSKNEESVFDIDNNSVGLNNIIDKLNEIKNILSDISNKDLFGNSLDGIITKLDVISEHLNHISSIIPSSVNETAVSSEELSSAEQQESESMSKIAESSASAAEGKMEFVTTNKEVINSIIESLKGLNNEAEAFRQINKVINNLANNKNDRITILVKNLETIKQILSSNVSDNSFIQSINELVKQGESLKDLAIVLKSTKKQVDNAKKNVNDNSAESKNVRERIEVINQINKLKTELERYRKIDNADDTRITDRQSQIKELEVYLEELKNVSLTEEQLKQVERDTASSTQKLRDEQARSAEAAAKRIADAKKKEQEEIEAVIKKEEADIEKQLKFETKIENRRSSLLKSVGELQNRGQINKVYGDELRTIEESLNNLPKESEEADTALTKIWQRLTIIRGEAEKTGKAGQTFMQMFAKRWKSLLAYLGSFASFYRIVGFIRQSIATIQDLDTQLVDLRKTTTMNNTELERFYKNSSDIAKQLGVTTSEIISQASAWSRFNKIDPLYGNI